MQRTPQRITSLIQPLFYPRCFVYGDRGCRPGDYGSMAPERGMTIKGPEWLDEEIEARLKACPELEALRIVGDVAPDCAASSSACSAALLSLSPRTAVVPCLPGRGGTHQSAEIGVIPPGVERVLDYTIMHHDVVA